ncbi:MAG: hypothetical protein ACTS44_01755 [Candidatus Hodgkinia cicadicola]
MFWTRESIDFRLEASTAEVQFCSVLANCIHGNADIKQVASYSSHPLPR